MYKSFLPFLLCFTCLFIHAQEPVKVEDRTFNFGGKFGMNSSLPIVSSISINGVEAEDITYQYQVGILGALFCRINVDRFFIQPSISWTQSSADIHFRIPSESGSNTNPANPDKLKYKIRTVEAPVLIGYKIVKEGPYGLSFMAGPNIKYSYDMKYTSQISNLRSEYESDSSPWGINVVCGVGVSIWRFFFDVTYEFGISKSTQDLNATESYSSTNNEISIDKRSNMLGFSLGFLF